MSSLRAPADVDFTSYVRNDDSAAFGRIVKLHLPGIRATAARVLGVNAYLADDVAQAVFIHLAKKARDLPADFSIVPWLHRQAVWFARNAARAERRRSHWENRAGYPDGQGPAEDSGRGELTPFLDAALLEIPAKDREAILLRYFSDYSLKEVGDALGLTHKAAQKRIERALEKLQGRLAGVMKKHLAAGTLLALLSTQSKTHAASSVLTRSITARALESQAAPSSFASKLGLLTVHAKAILAGAAAAGCLLGFSPLLISRAPDGPLSRAGISSPRPAFAEDPSRLSTVETGIFDVPEPASTGRDLYLQYRRIAADSPGDNLIKYSRLEAFLDQLNPVLLTELSIEAEKHEATLLQGEGQVLVPAISIRWTAILNERIKADPAATMLECESSAYNPARLLALAYECWVAVDFEAASQWLVKNQERPALADALTGMIGDTGGRMAERSPEELIVWTAKLEHRQDREAALFNAWNTPKLPPLSEHELALTRTPLSVYDRAERLILLAAAQPDKKFAAEAIRYLTTRFPETTPLEERLGGMVGARDPAARVMIIREFLLAMPRKERAATIGRLIASPPEWPEDMLQVIRDPSLLR